MAKTFGIHIRKYIEEEFISRGGTSVTVNQDLERLYDLYRRAIREVPLALDEARLIVDCCNGTIYDARSAPMLWASIEDSCHLDGLDAKWGIDGPALVEKLKGLTQLQSLALVDAAERFWNLPDGGRDLDADVRKFFNVSG
jgi:hypothetical protein